MLSEKPSHRKSMTEIIETYLEEMFKHKDKVSLSVLEVSQWKDIEHLGESRNYRNICHAMEKVRFKNNPICGVHESTTYTLEYTFSEIEN